MESSGSAIAENEKWLDSIEGKTYQFTNALQTMWSNIIDSEMVKGVLDVGTDLIQFLDTGAGKAIALVSALKLMAKFKGFSFKGIAQGLGDTINRITTAHQTLQSMSKVSPVTGMLSTENITAYANAVSGLTAKQQANLLASQNLTKQDIQRVLQINQCTEAEQREALAHVHTKATKEQEAAASQALFAARVQETAASYRNIQAEQQEAAAKATGTAATEASTTATEAETAAEILETAASQNASKADLLEMVSQSNLTEATKQQIIAELGLVGAKKTGEAANYGLLASIKALYASNPVGWILMIASAAISLIAVFSNLAESTEDVAKAAEDAISKYKEAQSTLKDQKKTVDELADSYERLSGGVDLFTNTNINLTTESYQEYLDTCNQIADLYPHLVTGFDAQGNAILSLKGNVDKLTQAYKDAAQVSRQEIITSGDDIFSTFKNEYDHNDANGIFGSHTGLSQKHKIAQEFLNAISTGEQDAMQKVFDSYIESEDAANMFKSIGVDNFYDLADFKLFKGRVVNVDEFKKVAPKLISLIGSLTTQINAETGKVKTLMDAYLGEDLKYAQLDQKAKSAVDNIISGLNADFINGFESADDLWIWIKTNVVDVFADESIGKNLSENILDAFNLQKQFQNNKLNLQAYREQMLSFVDAIKNSGLNQEVQDQIFNMFDIDPSKADSIGANIDTMLAYVQNVIGQSKETVQSELEKLGEGGSVDLLLRPKVEASIANENGWDLERGDIATILTNTFSNENGTIAMNFTPIIVDENGNYKDMLTPDELQTYAEEVIAGVREDDLNLKIGTTYEGKDAIAQAVEDANAIHELHEMYFLSDDLINSLSYSDLQIINSDKFNVDGSTISTWEQLQHEIELAKIAMTEDFTTDNFVDYADRVNAIQDSISTYQEALEKLESGSFTISDFIDLVKQFPELADGVDTSSKSFNGLSQNLKKAIRNSPDELVDELKDLREQLVKAGKSTTEIDNLINSLENLPIDTVASLSDEYITLADSINEAKVAQNELQEAMSEDKNSGFETRGEAIEKMKALMKEGKIGSESELWSIAEAFFGDNPEAFAAIAEKNADALAEFIAARNKWYATDKDGNYTFEGTKSFLNDVEAVVAGNKKLQNMGVKWNYDDATGALNFDFNNANWDEIVKILGESKELAGLTSDEFYDLLMQVGQFFDINWQDADDLLWFMNQINKGTESAAENFASTENAVRPFLESNGYSADLLELNVDDKEFKALPDEIQKVLEKYYELKEKFEADPLGITWQLEHDSAANKKNGLTDESLGALNQLVSTATDSDTGVTWFSFDELKNAAEEAKMDVDALMKQIEVLQKKGKVIDLKVTDEDPLGLQAMQNDAQSTINYLEALGLAGAELNGAFTIDVPSFVDMMIAAGWSGEQIQAYISSLNAQGYTFTYTTEENKVETLDVNTQDGQAKVNELVATSNEMTDTEVLTVNLDGTAEGALQTMKSTLDSLTKNAHTVTVNETTNKHTNYSWSWGKKEDGVDVDGTAHISGTAHARGSWGAPKTETALVGELGPEMLVRNGRWTTIGENGAEFRQIKKGDIIFNHKQTEELLSKGYVTGRGKAYASGTAYAQTSGTFNTYDIDGNGYTKFDVNKNVVDKLNNAASSLSDAADDISESSDEFREVFDWIEVRLEEINEDISLKSAQLENEVGHSAQNKVIDNMIALNQKLYNNLTAGAKEYNDFAKKLLAKVPEEYRKAAQDGSIAIETFVGEVDEKTLEAIQNYREWVQKGADATQQAEETLTEISNLAKQAIDNIESDFENKTSLNDSKISQLEAYNALLEADKGFESEEIYQSIIDVTNANIKKLKEQRNAMLSELDAQVSAGNIEKYSQNWYDAVNAISEVDTQIIELTADTEDYQDTINELHWDHFDALISQYEAVADEAENLIDILGSKDLVDKDTAEWTDEGVTSLGLYAQKMEVAEMQAKQYEKEIAYLNKNWRKLGYTETEYIEKLNELKDGQYDAIKAYNDTKDAIVDLNKERVDAIKDGIQKEIDAYEELINKKKEELDAEKDLHDFQKGVADQQKEIADIERKLAALSADNSASARAKRAQLEAELAKAQADLQETYYDRSISDQQEALDKELENFQNAKDKEMEGWDEYLENTNQVVSDSLSIIQANTDIVYQTLLSMGEEYSLSITESITSPWQDGEDAVQSFSEKFGLSMSSTVEELQKVANKYKEIMAEIEDYGAKVVDQTNKNAQAYQSANKEVTTNANNSNNNKPNVSPSNAAPSSPGLVSNLPGYLQRGSSGDDVRKLQEALNALGFDCGKDDGIFGDKTHAAVMAFQSSSKYNGAIGADGVVGPDTKKKFKVAGYAGGTTSLRKSGVINVDELGEELRIGAKNGRLTYMAKGSGIIPADLTANLMEWGQLDPSNMLEQNRPQIGVSPSVVNNTTEISIDASVGELVHIEHLEGNNPAEIGKIVDKAWDKHMKELNAHVRRYTNR